MKSILQHRTAVTEGMSPILLKPRTSIVQTFLVCRRVIP